MTATGPAAAHPAVAAYAARHRLDPDAFRSDGRVTLRFDGVYRVELLAAADGRVAAVSRLASLADEPPARREALVERLGALAAGMLQGYASGLCIDPRDDALVLQQLIPATVDADGIEASLGEFVNALSFWSRACAREMKA